MFRGSREKCKIILNWCIDKWGKSEWNNIFPNLKVYTSKGNSGCIINQTRAYYNDITNTIIVFLGAHNNYKELCNTIIHEYKHYKLDPKEFDVISDAMIKEGYEIHEINFQHPHEKICNKFAKKWESKCYNELYPQLRKRNK